MLDGYQIHQTTKADFNLVSEFLDGAKSVHRHLDWHPIFDWINSDPFLLLTHQNQIAALLALPPDPPGVAWVRCFAIDETISIDLAWQTLYRAARISLSESQAHVYSVGLEEWFSQLLERNGFHQKQQIVVLSWNHHLPPTVPLPEDVTIRPMVMEDLPAVASIDERSFEPVWVNTLDSIRLAFVQSEHTSVAEFAGKIIGYEMSTANQYSAHLARLAVLPEYRHHLIGRQLVRELLAYFSRHGTMQVTVNTQSDNLASLHLYKSLGFSPTYEEYPVYTDE